MNELVTELINSIESEVKVDDKVISITTTKHTRGNYVTYKVKMILERGVRNVRF